MYSCQSLTMATCYQQVRNVMPLRRALRYRLMSGKVVYYQFFLKMAEPAAPLAAAARRQQQDAVDQRRAQKQQESVVRRDREADRVKKIGRAS